MKNAYRFGLITLLLLTLGASCDPVQQVTTAVTPVQKEWVSYFPTQCNANPWGKQNTEAAIKNYYEAKGVTIYTVEVTPAAVGFMTCQACGCDTGEEVSVQTTVEGKAALLELGFTDDGAKIVPDDSNINAVIIPETNVNANTNTAAASDIDANANVDVQISPSETNDIPEADVDVELRRTAEQVQQALADYYQTHTAYPEELTELNLTVDTSMLSYTPIGVLPAEFYDLTVNYSTGQETLNP